MTTAAEKVTTTEKVQTTIVNNASATAISGAGKSASSAETGSTGGPADGAGEKTADKAQPPVVHEKRRALGRGLESLLPGGPRVVGGTAAAASATGANAMLRGGADGMGPAGHAPGDGQAGELVGDLQAAAGRQTPTDHGEEIVELPLDAVVENPYQTRVLFEPYLMDELAASIKAHGVIQPIVVRPAKDGKYTLIIGERRLRAAKMAKLEKIPAVVRRVNDAQAAEMTVIENIQREDLHCLEQAAAFAMLSQRFKMTQEEIGKKTGVSRETVSNYMRLLKLPTEVQLFLQNGQLEFSHARVLLNLLDPTMVLKVAQEAVRKHMSVVQLEDLVFETNSPLQRQAEAIRRGARWVDPNVKEAQRQLEQALGVRVRIRDRKGKGKIVIEYASIEDFDRVVEVLSGRNQ